MQRRVKVFLAAGIAVAAVATWVIWGRDSERRQQSAEEYKAAPDKYAEYARGYESAATNGDIGFTTCYGSRWDSYSQEVSKDAISHKGDKAYNAKMAERYRQLAKKYQDAIRRGQPPEKLDPPLGPQRTGDSP